MSGEMNGWLSRFSEVVTSAETFCFITRAEELRQDAKTAVEDFLREVTAEKARQIGHRAEDFSNFLLSLEFMLRAVCHELVMWSLLRADRADDAWEQLVAAQHCLFNAVRSHRVGECATARIPWLDQVEKTVFPPQIFMSPGMIVRRQVCSICGSPYGDCDHIKGQAYMGELCTVSNYDVVAREVSFVDTPADKRHRVLVFSDAGHFRNRMTWRVAEGIGGAALLQKRPTTSIDDTATENSAQPEVAADGATRHG